MTLKTGDEYIASVEALGLEANILGERTGGLTKHPLVRPSMRALATTFDCAHDEGSRALFRAYSTLIDGEVNRFTHLHRSTDDLVNKVLMQRHCGNLTGCCFQRCVGMDAANAVFSATFECDKAQGTGYHRRFCEYWAGVQREDLVVDGAMTDPKGDRGQRPSEQADPPCDRARRIGPSVSRCRPMPRASATSWVARPAIPASWNRPSWTWAIQISAARKC
jgi:4-hydroxybutyryl-CoA dehydratase/vinylacetyl-CoA-Delta-isomerase